MNDSNADGAMMRMCEPGWRRLLVWDRARRRNLWIRVLADRIQLCAGREGDDSLVEIPTDGRKPRRAETGKMMRYLLDVAEYAVYSQAIDGDAWDA